MNRDSQLWIKPCSTFGEMPSSEGSSDVEYLPATRADVDDDDDDDVDYLQPARGVAGASSSSLVVAAPAPSSAAEPGDIVPRAKRRRRTKAEMLAARAAPKPRTRYGAPSKRTPDQHRAIMARAREGKAQKRLRELTTSLAATADEVQRELASSAMLRAGHGVEVTLAPARGRRQAGKGEGGKGVLQVRKTFLKVKGTRRNAMSNSLLVAVAQSPLNSCKDVAKVFRCSGVHVRTARKVTAWAALRVQAERLRRRASSVRPLSYFVSSLAFDETSEKLALRIPQMQQSLRLTWSVLVSQQTFALPDPEKLESTQTVEVVRPTVALLSNAAPVVYRGLWGDPAVRDANDFDAYGCSKATVAYITHTDRDGCASNDRVVIHHQNMLPATTETHGVVLASDLCCCNHANQLIETSVCDLLGMDLVGSVYRAALLFRMGSYWTRILTTVGRVVEEALVVRRVDPLPSEYNLEWAAYLKANYQVTAKVKDGPACDGADEGEFWTTSLGGRAWEADLRTLLELLPTAWHEGALAHACRGEGCCKNYDLATSRQKVAHAVRMVLFRCLPCLPCAGKWTRTGPAVDHLLTTMMVHDILGRVLDKAFGKEADKHAHRVAGDSFEQAFAEEISWHEIAGKRMRLTIAFAKNPETKTRLLVFALVKEPLRYLTAKFLGAGARARGRAGVGGCARLCDFTRAEFSPIVVVEQYLRALLQGRSRRVVLLTAGNAPSAWKAQHQGLALLLRRACLLVAGWLHRRLGHLRAFPWLLASIGDLRLSDEVRESIAARLGHMPRCQLDPFFSRRLSERVADRPSELLEPVWVDALQAWARPVHCGLRG